MQEIFKTNFNEGWVENEDLRPKTQKRKTPLKITWKWLETAFNDF